MYDQHGHRVPDGILQPHLAREWFQNGAFGGEIIETIRKTNKQNNKIQNPSAYVSPTKGIASGIKSGGGCGVERPGSAGCRGPSPRHPRTPGCSLVAPCPRWQGYIHRRTGREPHLLCCEAGAP